MISGGDWEDLLEQSNEDVALRMNVHCLVLKCHLDSGEYQECAKDVKDPVELPDERHPDEYQQSSHQQGTDDSPEEDLVLVLCRHFEIRENHQEDEEIVDAQRFFDDEAREELESDLGTLEEVDTGIEEEGKEDPECAPKKRFLDLDFMRLLVEHPQVENKHENDKEIENRPEPGAVVHW